MDKTELDKILAAHVKCLSGANLSGANLSCAYLDDADLSYADLINADMRSTYLRYAYLRDANLRGANLRCADLCNADLRGADLHDTDLSGANLQNADLSGVTGLLSAVDYMKAHFDRTSDGYIAYKIFGREYNVPESWNIEKGSVITENVNFNRTLKHACGINVASFEWMKKNYSCNDYNIKNYDIWKVLIRWEWLCGVCVPYNTDGNIRCERVELIDNHIRLDEVE